MSDPTVTPAEDLSSDSYDHETFQKTVEELLGHSVDEGLSESPAPQAVPDAAKPPEPEAAKKWWETLPEDARQELEKERKAAEETRAKHEQYVRSNEGRVAALQRKADEAAKASQLVDQQKRRAAQAAADEDLQRLDDEFQSPIMTEVNKRTRDEVRAVKDKVESLSTLAENLQREKDERDTRDKAAQEAEARKLIETATSDLRKDFPVWDKDAATPVFQEWFAKQPDEVKALADSKNIGAARVLIKSFYDEAKPPSREAADIAARRKQQRENSVALDGSATSTADSTSEYDIYFKKYLAELLPPK